MLHPELSNKIHDRLASYGNPQNIDVIDALVQLHAETYDDTHGYFPNLAFSPEAEEVEDMVMDSFNYDPDFRNGGE